MKKSVRDVLLSKGTSTEENGAPAPANTKKMAMSFYLDADLVNEMRNAVAHLAGAPEYLTLTRLADGPLREKLEELKKTYNKGKPFPQRPADTKTNIGRPRKA
jgi:hypothetical protein